MTLEEKLRIKRATIDFITNDFIWINPLAITLTFKQSQFFQGEVGYCYRKLTRTDAERTVRHFRNRLDKRIYGNAALRHGKRCRFFGAFEGYSGGNLHYHGVIERPEHIEPFRFEMMIRECWQLCSDWGNKQIHIERYSDEGWISYCAKLRGKSDYSRNIDWSNTFRL